MKSLRALYRIGPGPSSSHTIAPLNAALSFKTYLKSGVDEVRVTLFGSLALTGVGHHTDLIIKKNLEPFSTTVIFDVKTKQPHPNTLLFEAMAGHCVVFSKKYISLGGGELTSDDDPLVGEKDIYPFRDLSAIKSFLADEHIDSLKDLCLRYEDQGIDDYMMKVVKTMFASVERGLSQTGIVPADGNPNLRVEKAAKVMFEVANKLTEDEGKRVMLLSSYAYAVAECNASGDLVVTAPTCGSSGVLPAVLYYEHKNHGVSFETLRDSLYAAGIFGNLVKQNASISGAIGGCQAEIGTATAMASVALCYVNGLSLYQMEYAAEVSLEHFLGLSCDPVDGYVIIPCIQRNGIGTVHAYSAFAYAKYLSQFRENKVSFDKVVEAMKLTGASLKKAYKETAQGGLASILRVSGKEKRGK